MGLEEASWDSQLFGQEFHQYCRQTMTTKTTENGNLEMSLEMSTNEQREMMIGYEMVTRTGVRKEERLPREAKKAVQR